MDPNAESEITQCPHCGSKELHLDPFSQDLLCSGCGAVIQENRLVAEVGFQEGAGGKKQVIGQSITWGHGAAAISSASRGSRELTVARARKNVEGFATKLRIHHAHQEQALRIFGLALDKQFNRGRKSMLLCAACLYIVCRSNKSPHLLIDFADACEFSVRDIGQTYIKLVGALQFDELVDVPVVDPSLFMERFAHKLDLGDKTGIVANTAVRLCGAALLVSARWHGFERDPDDVARVVMMAESTLRKRLYEMRQCTIAGMTKQQLMSGECEDQVTLSLPPCVRPGGAKSKAMLALEERYQSLQAIEMGPGLEGKSKGKMLPLENGIVIEGGLEQVGGSSSSSSSAGGATAKAAAATKARAGMGKTAPLQPDGKILEEAASPAVKKKLLEPEHDPEKDMQGTPRLDGDDDEDLFDDQGGQATPVDDDATANFGGGPPDTDGGNKTNYFGFSITPGFSDGLGTAGAAPCNDYSATPAAGVGEEDANPPDVNDLNTAAAQRHYFGDTGHDMSMLGKMMEGYKSKLLPGPDGKTEDERAAAGNGEENNPQDQNDGDKKSVSGLSQCQLVLAKDADNAAAFERELQSMMPDSLHLGLPGEEGAEESLSDIEADDDCLLDEQEQQQKRAVWREIHKADLEDIHFKTQKRKEARAKRERDQKANIKALTDGSAGMGGIGETSVGGLGGMGMGLGGFGGGANGINEDGFFGGDGTESGFFGQAGAGQVDQFGNPVFGHLGEGPPKKRQRKQIGKRNQTANSFKEASREHFHTSKLAEQKYDIDEWDAFLGMKAVKVQ
eukprot:g13165.t1